MDRREKFPPSVFVTGDEKQLTRTRHHLLSRRQACLRDRHRRHPGLLRTQLVLPVEHVSFPPVQLSPCNHQPITASNIAFHTQSYRYDVEEDGTFSSRKTFTFIAAGVPDGVHVDTKGNVYAGCGDGVHVFNPSGKLLGKIWIGSTVANFQFAGKGRMVILAETELYYATLKAEGAFPGQLY